MELASDLNEKDLYAQLQASMKQEIGVTREVLANMCQEEQVLLIEDRHAWNTLMHERSALLARLYELRALRVTIAKKLSFHEDCEILNMRDQLMALIDKMNRQNLRIQEIETGAIRMRQGTRRKPNSQIPTPCQRVTKGQLALAIPPDEHFGSAKNNSS